MAMRNDHYVDFAREERIARIANEWRRAAQLQGHWNFNIIQFVEHVLARRYKAKGNLNIEFFDREGSKEKEAKVTYRPLTLRIDRKIWERARTGDAFARFVVAHEVGHILLHDHSAQPFSYDPAVQNQWCEDENSAEWQANTFAYHFLLPDELVRQHYDVDALVEFCGVNESTARERLEKIVEADKRAARVKQSNGEACPECMNFTLEENPEGSSCTRCGTKIPYLKAS